MPNWHHAILCLAVALFLAHAAVFAVFYPFTIEDAGISFAYARNLALGHGLVPYPGAERVEGYSNPLWVLILALGYKVGLSPFVSARALGALFGALTLPVSYLLVRQARPGRDPDVALLAPLVLACSTQVALWSVAGLENALFGLLLCGGVARLCVELADPARRPWSAALFFLLAVTRPEGLGYAGFAGAAVLGRAVLARTARPALLWGLAFAALWGPYNDWRLSYFGWALPNTYYAKIGREAVFQPFGWNAIGWSYIKSWFWAHGVVAALPLLALAMTGVGRRRQWLGVVLPTALLVLVLWDGRAGLDAPPAWWIPVAARWVELRVWALPAAAILFALAAVGLPGGRVRSLLWANTAFGVFFALYSGGDWMRGYRWFNLIVPGLLPLLVVGLGELLDGLLPTQRRVRAALLVAVAAGWAAAESRHTLAFAEHPEISVDDVKERVAYMQRAQERLGLDHVVLADVDMGAHLYFSDWEIVDLAGLIDVPIAHHVTYPPWFVQEYIMGERSPDFLHIHGAWAYKTGITVTEEFRSRYLPIPPMETSSGSLHDGNHVRKDLFVTTAAEDAAPPVAVFGGDVHLVAFEVPSPDVAPGGVLVGSSVWERTGPRDFEVVVALDDGHGHRVEVPLDPGWDWYPPRAWGPGEQVRHTLKLEVPPETPTGEYGFALTVRDAQTGDVLPASGFTSESLGAAPGVTVRVRVVAPDAALAEAEADLGRALASLGGGACDEGLAAWEDATRHVLTDAAWRDEHEPRVHRAAARCLVGQASAAGELEARIDLLRRARRLDPEEPSVAGEAEALADKLEARGDVARTSSDWNTSYAAFRDALRLSPQRAHIRRKAEEARDLKDRYAETGWWAMSERASGDIAGDEASQRAALEAIGYVDGLEARPASRGPASGVTVYDRSRAWPGLNLVVSSHAPEAVLMDMDGTVLHTWAKDFEEIWPRSTTPPDHLSRQYWRRVRLLEGGDLLVIFENLGLARLSARSELVWETPLRAHHDIEVLQDGSLLVLAALPRLQPVAAHQTSWWAPGGPYVEDHLVWLNSEGKVTRVMSIMDALVGSEFAPLLERLAPDERQLFHTNEIQVLDGRHVAINPAFAEGSILLSLRQLEAVAVLDPDAEAVVWAGAADFRQAHDPELLDDGTLLIFDNKGSGREESAVRAYDPMTMEPQWEWAGTDADPLWSPILGAVQRLDNGHTLITESTAGRALEITAEGEIVWEYYNPHQSGPEGEYIGMLCEVVRLPDDVDVSWAGDRAIGPRRGSPAPP